MVGVVEGPAAHDPENSYFRPRRSGAGNRLHPNQPQATRMMVAPVAVRAQSWAEIIRPLSEELRLITSAHQNMAPAERARLRAAAAGTISYELFCALAQRVPMIED